MNKNPFKRYFLINARKGLGFFPSVGTLYVFGVNTGHIDSYSTLNSKNLFCCYSTRNSRSSDKIVCSKCIADPIQIDNITLWLTSFKVIVNNSDKKKAYIM